jgi:hypothetical protein
MYIASFRRFKTAINPSLNPLIFGLLQKLRSDIFHIQRTIGLLDNVDDLVDLDVESHCEGLDDFRENFSVALHISRLCGVKLVQKVSDFILKISVNWVLEN